MKNAYPILFTIFSIILVIPSIAYGIDASMFKKGYTPSVSFGGRVYVAPIPGLTCLGIGTSTITSANLAGAAATVMSGNGLSGTINKINGIYNMLPVYTTDPLKTPRTWQFILGRKKLIPSFTTCSIGDFPIPVLKTTSNYGVSH